jgi:hypothetical protein
MPEQLKGGIGVVARWRGEPEHRGACQHGCARFGLNGAAGQSTVLHMVVPSGGRDIDRLGRDRGPRRDPEMFKQALRQWAVVWICQCHRDPRPVHADPVSAVAERRRPGRQIALQRYPAPLACARRVRARKPESCSSRASVRHRARKPGLPPGRRRKTVRNLPLLPGGATAGGRCRPDPVRGGERRRRALVQRVPRTRDCGAPSWDVGRAVCRPGPPMRLARADCRGRRRAPAQVQR